MDGVGEVATEVVVVVVVAVVVVRFGNVTGCAILVGPTVVASSTNATTCREDVVVVVVGWMRRPLLVLLFLLPLMTGASFRGRVVESWVGALGWTVTVAVVSRSDPWFGIIGRSALFL